MNLIARSMVLSVAALCAASAQATGAARLGNAYYEDFFQNGRCNAGTCVYYSSSPTPTDAYLRIRHIGCRLSIGSTISIVGVTIQIRDFAPDSPNSQVLKELSVGIPQPIIAANTSYYPIDSDTLLLAGAGRYVLLDVQTSSTATVPATGCGITGDLVPPQ
ncbi:MAG: hypothetical protein JOZ16_06720 [Methylobacteriaceae bacterium]|nr:hypothetical protein [Methylobacteriaceae bacterium]